LTARNGAPYAALNVMLSAASIIAGADPAPLVTVTGDLLPDWDIPVNQRLLIISKNQSWLSHGFHKYPAKFFPELPRWAIKRYSSEGETVLDPMAGSGTVNVEALLANRRSVAVDVDPFARLLTRVKTTPLDLPTLDRAVTTVLAELDAFEAGGAEARLVAASHVPPFAYQQTWFRPFILEELGAIRAAASRIRDAVSPTEAGPYLDFIRICLSSIVREVSNADNNCTRTVVRQRLQKRIVPGMAIRLFRRMLSVNVARMRDFVPMVPANAPVAVPENADARAIPLPDASIDLAVTSPPYINAVDYPRTHQLEMYMLDLSPPGRPLAEAKRRHIGTEVVRAVDYRTLHTYGLPELDAQVELLFATDPRRAYIVHQYFVDMEANFREVQRTLKPGRHYVVVVGNNIIRNQVVPTHAYLLQVAERVGFRVETYFASEVIRHYIKVPRKERINQDWVLVLKR
jgi:DNA modification methylase